MNEEEAKKKSLLLKKQQEEKLEPKLSSVQNIMNPQIMDQFQQFLKFQQIQSGMNQNKYDSKTYLENQRLKNQHQASTVLLKSLTARFRKTLGFSRKKFKNLFPERTTNALQVESEI